MFVLEEDIAEQINLGVKLEIKKLKKELSIEMCIRDRDILNIVLDGHIKLLEPQYNMLTSIYIFGYDEIIKMKDVYKRQYNISCCDYCISTKNIHMFKIE